MNLTSAGLAGACLGKFASQYRLKLRQPTKYLSPGLQPDMPHIPGKRGWIRGDGSGMLKVFIRSRYVPKLLMQAKALRMENQGRGDGELMLWFDGSNSEQATWAIKTIRPRTARKYRAPSPKQLEALRKGQFLKRSCVKSGASPVSDGFPIPRVGESVSPESGRGETRAGESR